MGNICTSNFEKQQTTETIDSKNSLKLSISLGAKTTIDIISGNFRQHKSDSLFVITQRCSIDHSEPLREYTNEPQKIIEVITSQQKMFYKSSVSKNSPYKKLFIAILPKYSTEETQQYQQHFKNIIKQLLSSSKDITIELSPTTEGISQLPNQMLLAILFQELIAWKNSTRVTLIGSEKKMINLYKFQLLKTEACKLRTHEETNKERFSV